MALERKYLEEIVARLEKLEATVFGAKKRSKLARSKERDSYVGPTGGVRLLFDEGFFGHKRSIAEVHLALEKKNYLYIKDVVRNSLNRMSSAAGPLVAIKGNNGKMYAARK